MQVLVTGGGGFLGSRIARALLKEGNNVSVIGRGQYPHLPSAIKVFQALPFINSNAQILFNLRKIQDFRCNL